MQSSPGTEHESGEPSNEELRAQLDETRAQLGESEDRYLRARADLDNYRRRSERDFERRVREQSDELVRAWIEVVDSVERALALEDDDTRAQGLRALLEQMDTVLARFGVARRGEIGERFDPELHEAIAVVPNRDQEPGTVAEVARSGYSARDRVVRPAQVTVAGPSASGG
jgi:molecular chaperone GrpE